MLSQGQLGTLIIELSSPESRAELVFPIRYDISDWCVKDQKGFVIMTISPENLNALYSGLDNIRRYQLIPSLL